MIDKLAWKKLTEEIENNLKKEIKNESTKKKNKLR